MADPMVYLWKDTVTRFKWRIMEYLGNKDIPAEQLTLFGKIPGVMDSLLPETGNPKTLYTRDNLVLLATCWNDFYTWTRGNRWYREFPEWSFMISQFQIFVNEFEMKEIRAKENETTSSIDDLGAKMTTTTSSIEDLQGRVKELERPLWKKIINTKNRSGSGERMVDLLEDLEKLSCSEKREED
jgi:hypothetical protein